MHLYIYQINKSIGGADFLSLIDEVKISLKDVVNDVEYFGFSVFHLLKYIPD